MSLIIKALSLVALSAMYVAVTGQDDSCGGGTNPCAGTNSEYHVACTLSGGGEGVCINQSCVPTNACARVGVGRINCCANCANASGAQCRDSEAEKQTVNGLSCDPTGELGPGAGTGGTCQNSICGTTYCKDESTQVAGVSSDNMGTCNDGIDCTNDTCADGAGVAACTWWGVDGTQPCATTPGGPLTGVCRKVGGLVECGPAGSCDASKYCKPPPPCYETTCDFGKFVNSLCPNATCCETKPALAKTACALPGDDPSSPDQWKGECDGAGACNPAQP